MNGGGAQPTLWRLKLVFATNGAGVGTLMPYLAVYLAWRGLSASEVGLVLGLMAAVGVVAVPLWGAWADRGPGAGAALRLSCLGAASMSLLLLGAHGWLPAVLLAAGFLAAVRAPGDALADALAVGQLGSSVTAQYGSIRLWASAGFVLAVAVWGMVLDATSLVLVLLAYPVMLLVEAATVSGLPASAPRAPTRRPPWRVVMTPAFLVLLGGALLFGVAMGASWTLLPLRLTDLGGGVITVAAASVVGALTEIPVMRSVGWWAQSFGIGRLFSGGGIVFAVALVGYGLFDQPWLLVGASVLRGAGYAVVYVSLVAAVSILLPTRQQGAGQSLLQMTLMGLGPMVGASLGGLTYQHMPSVVFLAGAGLAVGGSLVLRSAVTHRSLRPTSGQTAGCP